jgi:hypothetical protein
MMRVVAGRWARPAECENPKSVRPWIAPAGKSFEPSLPAPAARAWTEAGMLNTLQCHQPLPFWASVSTIVSAKLCVPAGSPDQVSAGETFCPLQLPSTCAIPIGLPLLTFVEDSMNSASAGVAAAANAAPKISACILPSSTTRPLGTARPATAPPVVG